MVGYCSRPDPVAILHRRSETLKGVVLVPVVSWAIGESWAGARGLRHSRAGWVLAASETGRLESSGLPAETGGSPCLFALCRAGAAGLVCLASLLRGWGGRGGEGGASAFSRARRSRGSGLAAGQKGYSDAFPGGTQRACPPAAHAHLATRAGSRPGDLHSVLSDGQLVLVLEEGERAREAPGSAASSRGSLAAQRALGV